MSFANSNFHVSSGTITIDLYFSASFRNLLLNVRHLMNETFLSTIDFCVLSGK
jgi:hypothetical protein